MIDFEKVKKELTMVKLPDGFYLAQTVYMIPTRQNGLPSITEYHILSFGASLIGARVTLAISKKQPKIESLYCASIDMFGTIIFSNLEDALLHCKVGDK